MFVLFLNFSSRFNRIKNTITLSRSASNIENKDHFTFLLFVISLRLKNSKRTESDPPMPKLVLLVPQNRGRKGGGGPDL